MIRKVTLEQLFIHPVVEKHLNRSGVAHAVKVAEYAYDLAVARDVNPDEATKAALLHDIGHYTWYKDGAWDYDLYRENDIHAIKGASRAHEILIELGEDRQNAKEITIAILLHTDSYLPPGILELTALQSVVKLADEADEESGGKHHYQQLDTEAALKRIRELDGKVEIAYASYLEKQPNIL